MWQSGNRKGANGRPSASTAPEQGRSSYSVVADFASSPRQSLGDLHHISSGSAPDLNIFVVSYKRGDLRVADPHIHAERMGIKASQGVVRPNETALVLTLGTGEGNLARLLVLR